MTGLNMRSVLIVLSVLAVSSASCASISVARAPDNVRYAVEVRNLRPGGWFGSVHMCGGALVDKRWVLTSASCSESLFDTWGYSIQVVLGKRAGQKGNAVKATKGVLNPEKDLALLKLNTEVSFSDTVAPANLPYQGSKSEGSVVLSVFGSGDFIEPRRLTIMDHEQCQAQLGEGEKNRVCTNKAPGACKGDDGSPLVYRLGQEHYRLVGIVSKESLPCKTDAVGQYVDVAAYSDWIVDQMYLATA